MSAQATLPSRRVLTERRQTADRRTERQEKRLLEWAVRKAMQRYDAQSVHIEDYRPYLVAPNNWLSVVESRIRDSVKPDDDEVENSAEWLSADAAHAAIAFFRSGVEALPTEPHIYATNNGDLVAEFETPQGTMTSVVSEEKTILFTVLANDPQEPIQKVIRRGSNTFNDELRSMTKKLSAGQYGKMEPTK
jgi:hypothetical protein